MKFIIEIEDEPLVRQSALHGETAVYRAAGFKSLVFDEYGIGKLKPYRPEPDWFSKEDVDRWCEQAKEIGIHEGRREAWKAARTIYYFNPDHRTECFGEVYLSPRDYIENYSADEAVEKIAEYESKKIGDEIEWKDDGEIWRAVLLDQINSDGDWYVLTENGCIEEMHESQFHKTGKKYKSLVNTLESLKEH